MKKMPGKIEIRTLEVQAAVGYQNNMTAFFRASHLAGSFGLYGRRGLGDFAPLSTARWLLIMSKMKVPPR